MGEAADKIKTAYNIALSNGDATRDLGGDLKTADFARVLIQNILKL